eukprot:9503943-Pyramimonas_sp.AAC.2
MISAPKLRIEVGIILPIVRCLGPLVLFSSRACPIFGVVVDGFHVISPGNVESSHAGWTVGSPIFSVVPPSKMRIKEAKDSAFRGSAMAKSSARTQLVGGSWKIGVFGLTMCRSVLGVLVTRAQIVGVFGANFRLSFVVQQWRSAGTQVFSDESVPWQVPVDRDCK